MYLHDKYLDTSLSWPIACKMSPVFTRTAQHGKQDNNIIHTPVGKQQK